MNQEQLDKYKAIAAFLFMTQVVIFTTLMTFLFHWLVSYTGFMLAFILTALVVYLFIRLIDSIIKKEYNVFWKKAMHNEQRKS